MLLGGIQDCGSPPPPILEDKNLTFTREIS